MIIYIILNPAWLAGRREARKEVAKLAKNNFGYFACNFANIAVKEINENIHLYKRIRLTFIYEKF